MTIKPMQSRLHLPLRPGVRPLNVGPAANVPKTEYSLPKNIAEEAEVSREVQEARARVADGIWERQSIGVAATRQADKSPAGIHQRLIAARLDKRIAEQAVANADANSEDECDLNDIEEDALGDEEQSNEEAVSEFVDEVEPDVLDDDFVNSLLEDEATVEAALTDLEEGDSATDTDTIISADLAQFAEDESYEECDEPEAVVDAGSFVDVQEPAILKSETSDGYVEPAIKRQAPTFAHTPTSFNVVQSPASTSTFVDAPIANPSSTELQAPTMPPGYHLAADGVYRLGDGEKPPVRITLTPIIVDGIIRDGNDTSYTLRLRGKTIDRKDAKYMVPMATISGGKGVLSSALSDAGMPVLKDAEFATYLLCSADNPNLKRLLGAGKMGFTNFTLPDGKLAVCYVLPNQTIFADRRVVREDVMMLPQAKVPAHNAYYASGTQEEWKLMVEVTRDNILQTFALCLSLSGPLLALSNTENGGVHLYGISSRGKTLTLQLAVTVYGNGATPGMGTGAPSLVLSWDATNNALEIMAAAGNSTILAVDEVGQRVTGPVPLYGISGGQNKARATGGGNLRDQQTWSLPILSTGEIPMSAHIESHGRGPVKLGQVTRVLDLPTDGLMTIGNSQTAENLKRDCGRFFGTAGPAFVRKILNHYGDEPVALGAAIETGVDLLRDQLCAEAVAEGRTLQPHHYRAMRRVALAAFAGCEAAEDILPHTKDEVMAVMRAVRDIWLDGQTFESEESRAVENVRDYVQRFRGQMHVATGTREQRPMPSNCHGIINAGRLLLTESNFHVACAGLDTRLVARSLADAGVLHCNEGQFKSKVSIAELGIVKVRYYVLLLDRLFDDAESEGDAEGAI